MRRRWYPHAVTMVGMVLWLAGCGAAASVSPSASSTGPVPASPVPVTPDRSTGPAGSPEPDDLGQPATTPGPSGAVTVIVAAPSFAPRTMISATVLNRLDRAVYTHDSKTDCSILLLQRLDAGTWGDIPACAQMRPPGTVAIGPSRMRTVRINPASADFQIGMVLQPGTYRLKFTYRLTPGPDGDEPLTALSRSFKIG
jgi:hypothetical protein